MAHLLSRVGTVDPVKDSDRYGRAERMLREHCRKVAANEKFNTRAVGGFSAGPEELTDLAAETEKVRYGQAENAIDLDDPITGWLGAG